MCVMRALSYLHSQVLFTHTQNLHTDTYITKIQKGIAHQNVKANNIFMTGANAIKLSDYGYAGDQTHSLIWRSPELILFFRNSSLQYSNNNGSSNDIDDEERKRSSPDLIM